MKKFDWNKPIGNPYLALLDWITLVAFILMAFSPAVYIHVLVCILAIMWIFIAAMSRHFANEFRKADEKALEGWATSNRMWKEDIAALEAVIETLLAERKN